MTGLGSVSGAGGNPVQIEYDMEDLNPPENFAMVDTGVYRSSFPMKKNFPFLKKLGLRTILTLVIEDLPMANHEFIKTNSIRLVQIGVEGNKEPFKYIPLGDIHAAIREIRDPGNHPVLIHCNKGKHRTGCLIGCYRKTQGWALSSIFDEYIMFASPKERIVDQRVSNVLVCPSGSLVEASTCIRSSEVPHRLIFCTRCCYLKVFRDSLKTSQQSREACGMPARLSHCFCHAS
ncbi:unnamed protein product [Discosporangium mesarthrocarpum]